ncbi:MAG: hypothetical protein OIF36_03200 [Alphaproteobacteria bacterium]|jgi:outer membrane lipoprotein SlyB|nr:hypothetical protein [Alphaproteobacteria bacterium]MCV6599469.1 hypothetical protein [Alphaproteobacteria bacterium]
MKKLLFIALLLISACAKNIDSNVYNERETLQTRSILKGKILQVLPVKVEGDKVVGTGSGAIIGGLAGSTVGENDTIKVLSASLGALIGSGIGRTIDGWITNQGGYQYIIELRATGEVISIVQGDANPLKPGDEVLLLENRNQTRVIKSELK